MTVERIQPGCSLVFYKNPLGENKEYFLKLLPGEWLKIALYFFKQELIITKKTLY